MKCEWCGADLPENAERCRSCQGSVSPPDRRYEGPPPLALHPAPAAQRVASKLEGAGVPVFQTRGPGVPFGDTPLGWCLASVLWALPLGAVVGAIYAASQSAGLIAFYAAVSICSALFAVGVIAKGVQVGVRNSLLNRDRR